jgi:serine/threonine-protein kinase
MRWSRRLLVLAGLLAVAAVAAGALHWLALDDLRESRAASYRALLDAQVGQLQQWIDERRADVEQLAADPAVRRLGETLDQAGPGACADEQDHLATARSALAFRFGPRAPAVLHVLDPAGRILLSTLAGYCGTRLPEEMRARLELAQQRGSAFIKPMGGDGRPLVWFEAPLKDAGGQALAFIGYAVDATEAFRFLAEEGRFGATGETYVIDAEHRVLSPLRQPAPAGGRLAANPLLDRLAAARAASPDGAAGVLMAAYANYAGIPVVGAWRWLPRRGIGLVLEASASESVGPLRHLGTAAWALALASALALVAGIALRGRGGVERIGPYRVIESLGQGAMSNVYLAEHVPMKRCVALKVLRPHMATDERIARFKREAQLAGQLRHPNSVRIHDYGAMADGGFYLAMEYVEGTTFAELVEREGPLPPARTARLLRQVCDALAEAHALGMLHRDIKPQNLMVRRNADGSETAKVLDFGLVKQVDADHSRDLTAGLRILGTPAYLAPERIAAPGSADPRSDLYAVGAVAFFLLTGRKPFEAENDLQLTHRILHEAAPRVSAIAPDNATPALDDLVARCLAKAPADRPASAAELAAELAAQS